MAGDMSAPDVLLVSLGSTPGLRASDEAFAALLRSGGATVEIARAEPQRQVRTLALTDLLWARASAAAARSALAAQQPRAVVYSSVTAALLWPRTGAIRFDASSAENRPGHDGIWQRPLERRRLAEAPLLIPTSAAALAASPAAGADAVVVPIPVAASAAARPPAERDIAAITYASDPEKKGLGRVLAAWEQARRGDERLVVAGLDASRAPNPGDGAQLVGKLDAQQYRDLLGRSKLFLCAPRREDYGIAQLEALADGCQLVTTEAPGGYEALALARELDARLVGDDLTSAIRTALDDPRPDYFVRAAQLLEPYSPAAVQRIVNEQLLARLLG
jgi:glycosyltransferase involved in cell wall biosynthesis